MQRYQQSIATTARGTNTGITKTKAVSRLHLGGHSVVKQVNRQPANVHLQNINYTGLGAYNLPEYNKPESQLQYEDVQREKFLGYWKGVLRLYGTRAITNIRNITPEQIYEISKLVRAWPEFDDKTTRRLWDQTESRHQACLGALSMLRQNENEKERKTKNMTLITNLPPFLVDTIITAICVLPEEHPNAGEAELRDLLPRRARIGGSLQANVHEFVFTVKGNLTLESFLRALATYQTSHRPLGQVRHPKFLRLLRGSDPANPLERRHAQAGIDIANNYDFHMTIGTEGPPIVGAGTCNGLYMQMVMHRFVPDHDGINNVVPNVPANRPLQRYANFDTYILKTWALPKTFKLYDVKSWIDCGNPDKILRGTKLEAQQPLQQDHSEDDDSDDEDQHLRYVNRKASRTAQQYELWKRHYLAAGPPGKTLPKWRKFLGEIQCPGTTSRSLLIIAGTAVDRRFMAEAHQETAGSQIEPTATYLEKVAIGGRLHEWVTRLPNFSGSTMRANTLPFAMALYRAAIALNPALVALEDVLAAARTWWIAQGQGHDLTAGVTMRPHLTLSEQMAFGTRLYNWAAPLPTEPEHPTRERTLELAIALIETAKISDPLLVDFDDILVAAENWWNGQFYTEGDDD